MSDYIKREDAIKAFRLWVLAIHGYRYTNNECAPVFASVPSADVVPKDFHDKTCEAMAKRHAEEIQRLMPNVVKQYDTFCGVPMAEAVKVMQRYKAEQTEPQTDDKHAVCTGCDYYDLPNTFHPCASCVDFSKYKPKIEDEPQTDCAWK